jgi:hypothetical protein
MEVSRFFPILVTALALFGALAPQAARSADVLYIGDDGDNTIKRFDPHTGALDVSQGPGISGLAGPRGLVVDGGLLLVVNQNVNLDISGEVLRYSAATLQFQDRLIPSTDNHAPFDPDGLVLVAPSGLKSVRPCPRALPIPPASCDLVVAIVQTVPIRLIQTPARYRMSHRTEGKSARKHFWTRTD